MHCACCLCDAIMHEEEELACCDLISRQLLRILITKPHMHGISHPNIGSPYAENPQSQHSLMLLPMEQDQHHSAPLQNCRVSGTNSTTSHIKNRELLSAEKAKVSCGVHQDKERSAVESSSPVPVPPGLALFVDGIVEPQHCPHALTQTLIDISESILPQHR